MSFTYHHHPLDSVRSIRVLHLSSSAFGGPLKCSLAEVSLDTHPKYEALSYAWDSQVPDRQVLCDNGYLLITANCEAALRKLHRRARTRILWVDSICIDQSSIPERNQQVKLMGEIYRDAQGVIIWLGEAGWRTKNIFKGLGSICRIGSDSSKSQEKRDLQVGFHIEVLNAITKASDWDVFNRSWFERIWTLQEAILADSRNTKVRCGGASIRWSFLLFSAVTVDQLRHNNHPEVVPLGHLSMLLAATHIHRTFWIKTLKNTNGSRLEQQDYNTEMSEILHSLRGQRATDPRDMIFGLFSLFKIMKYPVSDPDYTKPCSTVYTEAAKAAIDLDGNLNILCQTFGSDMWPALPSWVPDWSVPYTHTPNSSRFTAGWHRATQASIPKYSFENEGRTLLLSGRIIDEISEHVDQYFTAAYDVDGVEKTFREIFFNPAYSRSIISKDILKIDTFAKWVQFANGLSSYPTGSERDESFIKIMLRGGSSDSSTATVFKEAMYIVQIGTDPSIEEGDLQIEHREDYDALRSQGIDKTLVDRMAKAQILNSEIHDSLKDISSAPQNQALVSTAEYKMLSAITYVDPNEEFDTCITQLHSVRLFQTKSGYLGAATKALTTGDKIALFAGVTVPMVVREAGQNWRIIGPAHIPGVMNGEKWVDDEECLTEFVII